MRVSSVCPLRVASLVWRPRPEAFALTVVCKATFVLEPGLSPLAPEQEAPWEADVPWGDDPGASLWAASDLAPFKRRVDVLAVGHAHAARGEPAASLVARLAVGAVDKRIEVNGRRARTPPSPAEPLPLVGFGPIAPTRPERAAKLRRHAATFRHEAWAEQPLPEDIDAGYFNAAPPDQQLDQLPAGEPIVLEHLHPAHPQLTTALEVVTPRAMLLRGGSEPQEMRMRCDTLWIDADRGICTLTWRGAVPLRHAAEDVTVIVTAERPQGGGDVTTTLVPARARVGAAGAPAAGALAAGAANAADAASTFVLGLRAIDPGGALPFTPAPQPLPFAPAPAPAPDDDVDQPAGAPADAVDDAATTLVTGLVPAAEPLPFQTARPPAGPVPAQEAAQPRQARAVSGSAPPDTEIDRDVPPPATEPAARIAEEIAAGATLPPALTGTLLPDATAGAAAEEGPAGRPALPAFLVGTVPLPPLPPPLPPLPPPPPMPPLPSAPASPEPPAPAAAWAPVPPAPARLRSEAPPAPPAPAILRSEPLPAPPVPEARWSEVPPAPPARWSEVPPAPAAPPMALQSEAPAAPAAPPMVLRSEAPAAPTAPTAPPMVLRSEVPPAPAAPPEEIPVERFAAISAEIAEQRAPRAEVLRAHALSERAWAAVERRFRALLEKDARAAGRLRAAHDAAYVAAVESFRGPITLPEYARIAVGLERGEPGEVLDALAIQRPALMPIVRVWTKKAAGHMALSAELMALLEALRAE
ncbi:DUF2169 domain-containing protein [Sorangium sp. So ce131]|uniref:DUF2169 family type VI secretion system accessory protein n=1 Tax=Sorangium sp. So ce131 TaxID=3133282 RepID=UPI003F5EB929